MKNRRNETWRGWVGSFFFVQVDKQFAAKILIGPFINPFHNECTNCWHFFDSWADVHLRNEVGFGLGGLCCVTRIFKSDKLTQSASFFFKQREIIFKTNYRNRQRHNKKQQKQLLFGRGEFNLSFLTLARRATRASSFDKVVINGYDVPCLVPCEPVRSDPRPIYFYRTRVHKVSTFFKGLRVDYFLSFAFPWRWMGDVGPWGIVIRHFLPALGFTPPYFRRQKETTHHRSWPDEASTATRRWKRGVWIAP